MMGGRSQIGYTIVEVLMVLAASGLILIIAIDAIEGKVNKTEFKTAISDIKTQIQLTMNEVPNGVYQPINNSGTYCDITTNAALPAPYKRPVQFYNIPAGTTVSQGQNYGCIFIGKIMQFDVNNDTSAYNIFNLMGEQCFDGVVVDCDAAPNLTMSTPFVAYPTAENDYPFINNQNLIPNNLVTKKTLMNNLKISLPLAGTNRGMYFNGNPSYQIGAVGFALVPTNKVGLGVTPTNTQATEIFAIGYYPGYTAPNKGNTPNPGLASQGISCNGLSTPPGGVEPGTSLGESTDAVADQTDWFFNQNFCTKDNFSPVSVDPPLASSVEICFVSGTTQESGLITIGGSTQQTSNNEQQNIVNLQVYENQNCN